MTADNDLYRVSYEFRRRNFRRLTKAFFYVGVTCIGIYTFLHFILFSVTVSSVSMLPSLKKKQIIFASPLKRIYQRGDLVVVKPLCNKRKEKIGNVFMKIFSLGRLPGIQNKDMASSVLLRRVVAIPGDTVYMKDFVVYIKEKGAAHFLTEFELAKKKYDVTLTSLPELWDNTLGAKGNMNAFTLGDGEYFVLGDNRNAVFDSRAWGALNSSGIKAGVLFVF